MLHIASRKYIPLMESVCISMMTILITPFMKVLTDDKVFIKASRKMYCLQGDLQDSTGSRTYFVIQMLIYMLVMRVKQSLIHAVRELL